jgi:hypothetical protein
MLILTNCEARRIGLLDGTILLCDSGAFNRFILSRDLDHGSYSDSTLEEQRRLRLSCASHALKVRRAVASWHGLAPMTPAHPANQPRRSAALPHDNMTKLGLPRCRNSFLGYSYVKALDKVVLYALTFRDS